MQHEEVSTSVALSLSDFDASRGFSDNEIKENTLFLTKENCFRGLTDFRSHVIIKIKLFFYLRKM